MPLYLCDSDDDMVILGRLLRKIESEQLGPNRTSQSYRWADVTWSLTLELVGHCLGQ